MKNIYHSIRYWFIKQLAYILYGFREGDIVVYKDVACCEHEFKIDSFYCTMFTGAQYTPNNPFQLGVFLNPVEEGVWPLEFPGITAVQFCPQYAI